jgi:hypothetical protein
LGRPMGSNPWGSLVLGEYQPFCMVRVIGVTANTSHF